MGILALSHAAGQSDVPGTDFNASTAQTMDLFKRGRGSWKPVDITVFNFAGDSTGSAPFGSSGASFKKYPVKFKVNGKSRKIYPIAVHPSLVGKYKYKILQVGKFDGRKGKKPIKSTYVHVVDTCLGNPCPKNHKSAKKNGAMLLDMQIKAARSLGLSKRTYRTYGSSRNGGSRSWFKARIVGKMNRKDMFKAKLYYNKKKFNCHYVPSSWLDGYKKGKPIKGNKKSCW